MPPRYEVKRVTPNQWGLFDNFKDPDRPAVLGATKKILNEVKGDWIQNNRAIASQAYAAHAKLKAAKKCQKRAAAHAKLKRGDKKRTRKRA